MIKTQNVLSYDKYHEKQKFGSRKKRIDMSMISRLIRLLVM